MLEFTFQPAQAKIKDQPYLYHATILEILLQTTAGDEGAKLNSQKIKSLFQLHYLLELLIKPDDMLLNPHDLPNYTDVLDPANGLTLIKPNLIIMITKIYIDSQIIDQFLFIKEQAFFTQYFDIELKRLKHSQMVINNQKYLRFFFDYVIVMMRSYSEKIIVKDANQEYKDRDDYQVLNEIVWVIHDYANTFLAGTLNASQYNNLVKFVYSVNEQGFRDNAGRFSNCLEVQQQGDTPLMKKAQSVFTKKARNSDNLDEEAKLLDNQEVETKRGISKMQKVQSRLRILGSMSS